MKHTLTIKNLAFALIFGVVSLVSQSSAAASDNAALALDWRIALPAELPPAQPEMAYLDQ